jgi:hypothetical protein
MKIFNLASLIATGFICTVSCSAATSPDDHVEFAYEGASGVLYIPKCEPIPGKECNIVTWEQSKDGKNIVFKSDYSYPLGVTITCPIPADADPWIPESHLVMEFCAGNSYGCQKEGAVASISMDQQTNFTPNPTTGGEPFSSLIENMRPGHYHQIDQNLIEPKDWGSNDTLKVTITPAYPGPESKCEVK